MAGIEAHIEVNNIDEIKRALQERAGVALEAMGLQAENYAVMELETPKPHADGSVRPNVDTGRLVNSITHVVENETTVAIGTNVEYAAYVEKGTSKTRAYPYLEPAIMNHVDEYKEIAEEYLSNG